LKYFIKEAGRCKNPRQIIKNKRHRDRLADLSKEAAVIKNLIKTVKNSKIVQKAMNSRMGQYVKEVDEVGSALYPKLRKAWGFSYASPVPGTATTVGASYVSSAVAAHTAVKYPKVQAVIDTLNKLAGTMQTEYQVKGKKVYRIYHSSSNFEGAKQPNLEAKYFTRKDEIEDFSEKREIIRRMGVEGMGTFKKLAAVNRVKTEDLSYKEIVKKSPWHMAGILGNTLATPNSLDRAHPVAALLVGAPGALGAHSKNTGESYLGQAAASWQAPALIGAAITIARKKALAPNAVNFGKAFRQAAPSAMISGAGTGVFSYLLGKAFGSNKNYNGKVGR